ncbi:hypothetical protein CL614_02250 [archaeon]|nr:hypothetical protein [archaeon]|tara:strand:- start:483 stop:980 length:498 start_codon:yes stop_codon:yes gene_type:complete
MIPVTQKSIIQKIIGMITSPTDTLQSAFTESLNETLLFLAVLSIIQLATSVLLNLEYIAEFYQIFGTWVTGIIMLFVMTGIFHIFTMVLRKGTDLGSYFQTLRIVIYANVIFALFGWIPFVAIIATIWFIYLLVKGFSLHYQINKKRALAIILLPYLIFVLLSFI